MAEVVADAFISYKVNEDILDRIEVLKEDGEHLRAGERTDVSIQDGIVEREEEFADKLRSYSSFAEFAAPEDMQLMADYAGSFLTTETAAFNGSVQCLLLL